MDLPLGTQNLPALETSPEPMFLFQTAPLQDNEKARQRLNTLKNFYTKRNFNFVEFFADRS